jgi:WhiB family redox-sensing transcriptional regulator
MVNETLILEDATWRDTALCLSHPAILFFGLDDLESPAERRTREDQAKLVCAACPVKEECLECALSMREPYGIWGGLTEIERKAHLRALSGRPTIPKL